MSVSAAELAAAQAEYRKWLWTTIGHVVFFVACVVATVVLRRMFRMPPALLTIPIVLALLFFGGDVLKFLRCRRRLRELREADSNPS